jgi:hypothetical protein
MPCALGIGRKIAYDDVVPRAGSEVSVDAGRVVVRLAGDHEGADASACALAVLDALRVSTTGATVIDLREFSSMSMDAQAVWQAALSDLTGCIRNVTLVGGTPLARTAILALCLRAGIPVRRADAV